VELKVLGRTNKKFPSVWLKLLLPREPDKTDSLVSAAVEAKTVIDVTSQPALFGGFMRGSDATLAVSGGLSLERAVDEKMAMDFLQAELIQSLSAVGRMHFDFFFLQIRKPLEEFQIAGAMQSLELARQEGHIKFLGLDVVGPPLPSLGIWHFHDAFEVIKMPYNPCAKEPFEVLADLAKERRVGIITHRCLCWKNSIPFMQFLTQSKVDSDSLAQSAISSNLDVGPVSVGVRDEREIGLAISALGSPKLSEETIETALDEMNRGSKWGELAKSSNRNIRELAEKWLLQNSIGSDSH